jgi:hypothetical protein
VKYQINEKNVTEGIEQIRENGESNESQVKMAEAGESIGQNSLMNGLSVPSHIPQLISNSFVKKYFDNCHNVDLTDKCKLKFIQLKPFIQNYLFNLNKVVQLLI